MFTCPKCGYQTEQGWGRTCPQCGHTGDWIQPGEAALYGAGPRMTEGERALLLAIRDCEMHDGRDPVGDPMWVEVCTEGFGRSAQGYMASLVKKGWARTDGETCSITQAGADALKAGGA